MKTANKLISILSVLAFLLLAANGAYQYVILLAIAVIAIQICIYENDNLCKEKNKRKTIYWQLSEKGYNRLISKCKKNFTIEVIKDEL